MITFENQDDAKRVMEVLGKRMGRFGLTLHPDKTRLVPFRRPPAGQSSGKGPATFDFLGFTLHYARAKTGRWGMCCKTRSSRLRRTIKSIADWCRGNRHKPVKVQHEALCRRIQGHYNYFGVSGNFRCLLLGQQEVRRAWFKWLRPSESKNASELGEVFGTTQAFPSPASQYPCPNLGRLATSHTDGGAVWWKSPSTDLARARGGRPLLATLQRPSAHQIASARNVRPK